MIAQIDTKLKTWSDERTVIKSEPNYPTPASPSHPFNKRSAFR